jgi:hypothetical protein
MATYTVDIYRAGIKLGSGTATGGSASISSYTAFNPGLGSDVARTLPKFATPRSQVEVTVTQAGTKAGMTFNTRIVTDGGATLTLEHKIPLA